MLSALECFRFRVCFKLAVEKGHHMSEMNTEFLSRK